MLINNILKYSIPATRYKVLSTKYSIINKYKLFILLILSLSFFYCNENDKNKKNNNNISIKRYEYDLFNLDLNKLSKDLSAIKNKYPVFLSENNLDSVALKPLRDYLTDPFIKELYKVTIKQYPELSDVEKQISDALKNYLTYFPDKKLPSVYSYISGLDYDKPVKYDLSYNSLIIALDMYLGTNSDYYIKLRLPAYKRAGYNKEFIVNDCITELALQCQASYNASLLLDYIIQYGKILYFKKLCIANLSDELNMLYTKEQIDWCIKNEANIWTFLISNKLLFSGDNIMISKLINDAPFTSLFGADSPPRIGQWLGLKIIESYMKNNKTITLKELMQDIDSKAILNKSKYKPNF